MAGTYPELERMVLEKWRWYDDVVEMIPDICYQEVVFRGQRIVVDRRQVEQEFTRIS